MSKDAAQRKLPPHVFLHVFILAILSGCVLWTANENLSTAAIPDFQDASAYARMAYHLYHHGVISESFTEPPRLGNRREPGFPAYLAFMMRFCPDLQKVELADFTKEQSATLLRKLQMPLLPVAAIGAWLLTFLLTGRLTSSYIAMLLVGFSQASILTMNSLFRELFMGVVLLGVAVVLVFALRTRKPLMFGLLGLVLSGLVLTNAIFQYFIVVLIGLMIYLLKCRALEKKQFLLCLILLGAGYIVPTGAWMMRNGRHFGRFYITDRAGDVMAIRAEYNKMTADEYLGAFVWWTPDPFFQKKAMQVMQEQRRWLKLHRSNPEGYYAVAKALTHFIEPDEQFENPSLRDKIIQQRAIREILRHPFRHLAATLPFAWRGMFFEQGYLVSAPFEILLRSILVVSLLYFASLFFWVVRSFRTRQWELFGVTLLCVYLFGLNAFFSHNIPRYNQPMLPVLAVLFSMSLCRVLPHRQTARSHPASVRKKH
jgi:hypothetical protein